MDACVFLFKKLLFSTGFGQKGDLGMLKRAIHSLLATHSKKCSLVFVL